MIIDIRQRSIAITALALMIILGAGSVGLLFGRWGEHAFARKAACTPLPQDPPWLVSAAGRRIVRAFERRLPSLHHRMVGVVARYRKKAGSDDTDTATSPKVVDARLTVTPVVEGLVTPTTLAFIGPDEFLMMEKNTGRVKHVKHGAVTGTVLDLAVNYRSERGGLGIAVHPRFVELPYVYIFWTWNGKGSDPLGLQGPDSSDAFDTPPLGNRLDRFIWNGRRLLFERNISQFPSQPPPGNTLEVWGWHNGGVVAFGPDGKLYAVVGDQQRRGQMQNIAEGHPPTNANFSGIILRLDGDGVPPSDNPFFLIGKAITGEVGGNIQRIFAYGIRNGFAMAFDPIGGHLWMAENGSVSFDEINRVVPGFNSGWIQIMGPPHCYRQYVEIERKNRAYNNYNVYYPVDRLAKSSQGALERLFALPGSFYGQPEFSWKFAVAPSAMGFLSGTELGAEYYGDLFVGDIRGNLYRFDLSQDREKLTLPGRQLVDKVADNRQRGDPTESLPLLFGTGFGTVTDIKTAPDGSLFIVSLQGKVYRITLASHPSKR